MTVREQRRRFVRLHINVVTTSDHDARRDEIV